MEWAAHLKMWKKYLLSCAGKCCLQNEGWETDWFQYFYSRTRNPFLYIHQQDDRYFSSCSALSLFPSSCFRLRRSSSLSDISRRFIESWRSVSSFLLYMLYRGNFAKALSHQKRRGRGGGKKMRYFLGWKFLVIKRRWWEFIRFGLSIAREEALRCLRFLLSAGEKLFWLFFSFFFSKRTRCFAHHAEIIIPFEAIRLVYFYLKFLLMTSQRAYYRGKFFPVLYDPLAFFF